MSVNNKLEIIKEIKSFLDGYNEDLKYLVNVEADSRNNYAECIIHPPNEDKQIVQIEYTPFMYMKDLEKNKIRLYGGDDGYLREKMIMHGIKIEKMETGNQKRLEDGYCYKISSYKSQSNIVQFLTDGGINPYEKKYDDNGKLLKDKNDKPIYLNRHLFFSVRPVEQFLIDKRARLYKGFEEYKHIHKVTFDIETTGLRPEISRVFAIGVRDNRGFEKILEVEKTDDDESERELIRDFFNTIAFLNPAIISGYNSEEFDFYYILGRANILQMDLTKLRTSLKKEIQLKRRGNSSVKIGGSAEKYTATEMWGISVIDILHASKKTAALDSDMKFTNLKYVAKYEKIAKENRTYIAGEDNDIGRYYHENPIFLSNSNNEHIEVPINFKKSAHSLYLLQEGKSNLTDAEYKKFRNSILKNDPDFVAWIRKEALEKGMSTFVLGKKLLKQYLLDDLWETEQVDELYNQSSFMLAKIVPTTYTRICTMGTASVWNLLLTAWSYDRGLAIPISDVKKDFSGGLSRCYKKGYIKRLIKIDYASLYPMLQLTWNIFPLFDISGVMKKMLVYMTTTRNIYKKLATSDKLNEEELELMKDIDHETYLKYVNDTLTPKERASFKVKQLPIKILNNSQFGALGSDVSFNWSDNECAARITCCGRIELRHATKWFEKFDCIPLYAVTDGINFQVPDKTKIIVNDEGISEGVNEGVIEEMWKYGGKVGINALIEYFNDHEMKKPFMAVDNDGEFLSCFNLARINYAVLQEVKDKKTGEVKNKIKLTGNSLKSSVLSEYIEEFMEKGWKLILDGKGPEFVEYYYQYVDDIYYKQIPLKKIASKSRYKSTLKQYNNRGKNKNGKDLPKQAHMELVILERNKIAEELFQKHKENLEFKKNEEDLTIEEKMKLIEVYMPPEPELDSTLYYYNTGYRKSHGDSKEIKDKETGEMRFASTLVSKKQMLDNPEMTGEYNVDKYLEAFNNRVCYSNKKIGSMLAAFDPEIAEKIPARIERKKEKQPKGKSKEVEKLIKGDFTRDQLKLKSFDLDDVDESMYLEEKEVEFWNEYGYDPRLVWGGFKMHDNMKVYPEIYDNALRYLNEKLKESGKNKTIKSRNEVLEKGDLVLLKNGPVYSLGAHNGDYIKIIRENIEDIPKSEIEIEIDRKREERQNKKNNEIKNLEENNFSKTDIEIEVETIKSKREKYYPIIRDKFNIPHETLNEFIVAMNGQGFEFIDDFIKGEEEEINDNVGEYYSVDDM